MPTTYPYAAGKDPTYDAWKAQADYQRAIAQQDADFARTQALDAYNKALADLTDQGVRGSKSINTSMLGRGVYRSGETNRRQAELAGEVLKGKEGAGVTYQGALGKVDSDLARALTSLDLEAEQQVQAAMARAAGGGGGGRSGGGGGGGGSTVPGIPPLTYDQWALLYGQQTPQMPNPALWQPNTITTPYATSFPGSKPTPKPGKTLVGKAS